MATLSDLIESSSLPRLTKCLVELQDLCDEAELTLSEHAYGESLGQHDQRVISQISPRIGLVLEGSVEHYLTHGRNWAPINVYRAGDCFHLPLVSPVSHLSAGARSMLMLPKISDAVHYQKMSTSLKAEIIAPAHLGEQQAIFSQIARLAASPWRTKILWIDSSIIAQIPQIQSWYQRHCHQQEGVDALNFVFSTHLLKVISKVDPYLRDLAFHLFALALGKRIGLGFSQDEALAPMRLIQDVYTQHYGLKHYAPLLLGPRELSEHAPLYCSLGIPLSTHFSPKGRGVASKMDHLGVLKHLVDKLHIALLESDCLTPNEQTRLQCAHFEFFHTTPGVEGDISDISTLISTDPHLQSILDNLNPARFPERCAYLRGCVRVRFQK